MKKYFSHFERDVFERLADAGESYIVGGIVREIVLGKIKPIQRKNPMFMEINERPDVDIVTSLKPIEVMELFPDYRVEPYGINYGTVAVCDEVDCIDITTMKKRIWIKADGLVGVEYGKDIITDLKLRDFTINTLLINEKYQLVDHFNAVEDVKNKILKFPPSDVERYVIDPIVLFRAARFISHGFKPDEKVTRAFYDKRVIPRLKYLSTGRVLKEMYKMSRGDFLKGLFYLHDSGILYAYFPELEDHKKYIAEAIKLKNKKEFKKYILEHDPDPDTVFYSLQLSKYL